MSRRTRIVEDRYAQGQALYRSGQHIKDIFHVSEEIEKLHENPELTNEQHEEIEASSQSVIVGFADSLIDDIRSIARSRGNLRA